MYQSDDREHDHQDRAVGDHPAAQPAQVHAEEQADVVELEQLAQPQQERRDRLHVLRADGLASRETKVLSAPKMLQVPSVTMNGGSLQHA